MNIFLEWVRQLIKSKLDLYDINDLQIGGNCGCCGTWISDTILEKNWSWDLCIQCQSSSNEENKDG